MIRRELETNYRDETPFFNGFTPVWPLTLFGLALLFVVIFLGGLLCHLIGWRRTTTTTTMLDVPPAAPSDF